MDLDRIMGLFRAYRKAWVALLLLAACLIVYLNGTRVRRIPGVDYFRPNASFLSHFGYRAADENWNEFLLGRSDGRMAERHRLLTSEFDRRVAQGSLTLGEQAAYHAKFEALTEDALSGLYRQAATHQTQRFQNGVAREVAANDGLQPLRMPAAVLAGMVAVYSGRTLNYRLSDGVQMSSRSRMTQNRFDGQSFGLSSRSTGANFDYNSRVAAFDTSASGYEATRASVYQEVSSLGTRATASFGSTSNSATLGVTQALSEHVNVSYGRSQGGKASGNQSVGVGLSAGF